jgi:hypothetical protein
MAGVSGTCRSPVQAWSSGDRNELKKKQYHPENKEKMTKNDPGRRKALS